MHWCEKEWSGDVSHDYSIDSPLDLLLLFIFHLHFGLSGSLQLPTLLCSHLHESANKPSHYIPSLSLLLPIPLPLYYYLLISSMFTIKLKESLEIIKFIPMRSPPVQLTTFHFSMNRLPPPRHLQLVIFFTRMLYIASGTRRNTRCTIALARCGTAVRTVWFTGCNGHASLIIAHGEIEGGCVVGGGCHAFGTGYTAVA